MLCWCGFFNNGVKGEGLVEAVLKLIA